MSPRTRHLLASIVRAAVIVAFIGGMFALRFYLGEMRRQEFNWRHHCARDMSAECRSEIPNPAKGAPLPPPT